VWWHWKGFNARIIYATNTDLSFSTALPTHISSPLISFGEGDHSTG